MYIRYPDGHEIEGVLLSRTDDKIRVLARGAEDAEEYRRVGDAWISETCEPVEIEFRWQRRHKTVTEEECICSTELAARLIRLLIQGDGGMSAHADLREAVGSPEASLGAVN